MMFSVAPTLGKGQADRRAVQRPPRWSRKDSRNPRQSLLPFSRQRLQMQINRARPSSQPPERTAQPVRPGKNRAQKNDGRTHFTHQAVRDITLGHTSGIYHPDFRPARIRHSQGGAESGRETSTSDKCGQLCSTHSLRQSKAAAISGSVLFFAPCTFSSPARRFGPVNQQFHHKKSPLPLI